MIRALAMLSLWMLAAAPAWADVCSGCSSKGGPGFRLPSGHCASWKQHAAACDGACYLPGTVDERPTAPPTIVPNSKGKAP